MSSKVKRANSPIADIEFADAADDAPDQSVEQSGLDDSTEKLIFRIRKASSAIYKEYKRPARNSEIAEALGEEEDKIKSARDSLKLARQNRKLGTFRKKAIQAGFSTRNDMTDAEALGLDMERTLITMSDIKRLMRANPLDFEKGSYNPKEAKMRMDMMFETLPVGSAREIISCIEPLFRSAITECVDRQLRLKTQRITPATMLAVLKKYDNGVFTSVKAPEGLVKYAKTDGIEADQRTAPEEGNLMKASPEDKKAWKSMAAKNKQLAAEFEARVENEKKRKSEAHKAPKEEEGGAEDGADEDNAEVAEEVDEAPKKKKKRTKEAAQ